MAYRFVYDFGAAETAARLTAVSKPYPPGGLREKNTLFCRLRGASLLLTSTGSCGERHPRQDFAGRLRESRGTTVLRGGFRLCSADMLRLLVPSLLLALGGGGACILLPPAYRLIFAAALVLSLGILWSFYLLMAHFVSLDEKQRLLRFLAGDLTLWEDCGDITKDEDKGEWEA